MQIRIDNMNFPRAFTLVSVSEPMHAGDEPWEMVIECSHDVSSARAADYLDQRAGKMVSISFVPDDGPHRGKRLRGRAMVHARHAGERVRLTGQGPLRPDDA